MIRDKDTMSYQGLLSGINWTVNQLFSCVVEPTWAVASSTYSLELNIITSALMLVFTNVP